MKKRIFVAFGLIVFILFSGCVAKTEQTVAPEKEPSPTEDTLPAQTEETKEETDEIVIPQDYAVMITLAINPEFQLYLDEENVVLACVPVNDDAKDLLNEIAEELTGKAADEAIEAIVSGSVDQGYLTEEKQNSVSIEMTEVKVETYQVQESLTLLETTAKAVMEENAITNPVETSISADVQEIVTSQVCPDCGGTGFTCPNCGGHEWEKCVCCKGTGYQTCTNCRGSKVQKCPGCKGTGDDGHGAVCTYCGGTGGSTCEVCGGAGGYNCSRCYGFTYACPKCEYAVEYCPICHK